MPLLGVLVLVFCMCFSQAHAGPVSRDDRATRLSQPAPRGQESVSSATQQWQGLARSLFSRRAEKPEQLVDEITSQVVAIRGLALLHPIKVRVITRGELEKLLKSKIAQDLPANYLPNYGFVLKLLGALPEQTDLKQLVIELLTEQVAGLYDDKQKALYVMKDFDLERALGRIILAHEICHALQDQHFELKKLPLNDPQNDDLSLAVSSAVEGDATLVMQEYAQKLLAQNGKLWQMLDLLTQKQKTFNRAPYFLRQLLTFPYLSGATFVSAVSKEKPSWRNRILTSYPRSTMQVLHPEVYLEDLKKGDQPTSSALPQLGSHLPKPWRCTLQNVFGELQIRLIFESLGEWSDARPASEGWKGDCYALFRNPRKDFVFSWLSSWQSVEDADEFFELFGKLLRARHLRAGAAPEGRSSAATGASSVRAVSLRGALGRWPAVYVRLAQSGKAVIVEISNVKNVLESHKAADEVLLRAAAK